jgi:hypothetical protein
VSQVRQILGSSGNKDIRKVFFTDPVSERCAQRMRCVLHRAIWCNTWAASAPIDLTCDKEEQSLHVFAQLNNVS